MASEVGRAFAAGLSDAVGFVVGALAGWSLGRLLGCDFIGSAGYDLRAMAGLVFILVGCGAGKLAAQRWRAGRGLEP